jgi:SAM-dependent methyltransferase
MNSYATLRQEIEDICFKQNNYPSAWPIHESCPCCGSQSIKYSFSKYNMAHWICRSCKFVFLNPYPNLAILERLYNASYYPAVRKYIEIPKAIQGDRNASLSLSSEIYSEIISYVGNRKQEGKWLDVGGGIGGFLNHVRTMYPHFDLSLNEKNTEAHVFAQDFYGLKVYSEPPETLAQQGIRFDIITILSVLEHTSHPLEFIRSYAALLNTNGLLIINIPRLSKLNRWVSKSSSSNIIPPYHLSFFNEKNIISLLSRVRGFNNIDWWQCGHKAFSLFDIMQIGEYFDVETPQCEMISPKCIQVKSYTPLKDKIINKLAKYDRLLEPIITKIDGKLFLNVVATMGE